VTPAFRRGLGTRLFPGIRPDGADEILTGQRRTSGPRFWPMAPPLTPPHRQRLGSTKSATCPKKPLRNRLRPNKMSVADNPCVLMMFDVARQLAGRVLVQRKRRASNAGIKPLWRILTSRTTNPDARYRLAFRRETCTRCSGRRSDRRSNCAESSPTPCFGLDFRRRFRHRATHHRSTQQTAGSAG